MPQLIPFSFLNQVSYGFLALFCLVFILSRYLLPLLLQLQLTRKAFEQSPHTILLNIILNMEFYTH
jgi:F-type H+-transporting ATPase subunit 8